MPQLDFSMYTSQLFWLFISFGLMLLCMRFLILPRIKNILEQRSQYIEKYIKKAEKIQENADETIGKYNSIIEQASLKSQEKILEEENLLAKFIQEKSAEITNSLDKKIRENQSMLENQRKIATNEAAFVAKDLSVLILNKLNLQGISTQTLQQVMDEVKDNYYE